MSSEEVQRGFTTPQVDWQQPHIYVHSVRAATLTDVARNSLNSATLVLYLLIAIVIGLEVPHWAQARHPIQKHLSLQKISNLSLKKLSSFPVIQDYLRPQKPTHQRFRKYAPINYQDKEIFENPDLVDIVSKLENTKPPLVHAALNCDIKESKKLLSWGADVDSIDTRGDSALAWAAKYNCLSVARLLLANGANPFLPANNGFTPLQWASWNGSIEVKQLLELAL